MSDDFFIPTGEELDEGAVGKRPKRRFRRRKAETTSSGPKQRKRRLDVPDDVASKPSDGLLDTGASGRVVRSVSADSAGARRDFVLPPELKDKYGIDE